VFVSPTIADIDLDGDFAVLFGSVDKYFYCLSATGSLVWKFKTGDWIVSSPAIGDLEDDGLLDIVIGSYDHKIYCINNDGTLKLFYTTNGKIASSSLADLNNDGLLEVLIGSGDNNLYCLNEKGELMWFFTTNDYIHSTPLVVDINNDEILEILIGSTDNYFYCFSLNGIVESGSNSWYSFRGTMLHTGWMDSDNNLIDDFTEGYLTSPNYPYLKDDFPSFNLTITPVIFIGTVISVLLMKKRKKN